MSKTNDSDWWALMGLDSAGLVTVASAAATAALMRGEEMAKDIHKMASDLYQDDAVAAAVVADAERLGNVDKILRGELHLPSPQDAKHWHERTMGAAQEQSRQDALEKRIAELESTLNGLTGNNNQ